ncbi:nucleotidyl transferase AbiEii/AbiGii toxin family protein [Streptomyces sp. NPDC046261]|uniref:nucleotidyl transferase AbiEii/AbiGii toxin family protein n=1 Tax=Streptomyces sp. NPDC046261 TaxID=3157200 RepID=UPI0033E8F531
MTTTPWERFGYGPWDDDMVVPRTPPAEVTRADKDLPRTLRPVPGEGVRQRPAYDPAANHHERGMRLSEPQFTDDVKGRAWYAARRHALDLALAAVAGSEWAGHLVLRGSMLLKSWFGDAAREPGDLDFVVVPATWRLEDERTDAMLDGIARAAEALSRETGGPVRIDAAGAVSDEIWTYDRVPGRRLVLPWSAEADGVPPGTVQLDFVFNETLPAPAVRTEIAGRQVNAASPELSLVWKILWLVTDHHPEAKDLYDAVLLAESAAVPYELLKQVLVAAGECSAESEIYLSWILAAAENADWFEFLKDRPMLQDTGDGYLARLVIALAPAFAAASGEAAGDAGAYAHLAAAFAGTTAAVREEYEAGGMAAVEKWFMDRTVHSVCAVVVMRELLGREECTLREAADALVSFRRTRWGGEVEQPYAHGLRGDPHDMAVRIEAADVSP